MAFASTRIDSQRNIIKPCDLCEEDENVNWFCKDCGQNLCDKCKKLHLRSNISKSHMILLISEGYEIGKRKLSNICRNHDRPFLYFCQTCDKSICSECLSAEHKKHDFMDLHELQLMVKKQVDDIVIAKEEEKKKMTKTYDDLVKQEKESESSLTEEFALIDDKVKVIKSSAVEEGRRLKEFLRIMKQEKDKCIEKQKQELHDQIQALNESIPVIQKELSLQTASYKFMKEFTTKLHSIKPVSFEISVVGQPFSEGNINVDSIRDMIGNIEKTEELSETSITEEITGNKFKPAAELTIMKSSTLKTKGLCNSTFVDTDGSIWVVDYYFVYKMNSDCSTITHQIPLKEDATNANSSSLSSRSSIALLPCGDIVVHNRSGYPCMERLTSDGRRIPIDIHYLKLIPSECHIAATIYDEIITYERGYGESLSKLNFFSYEGELLKEIFVEGNIQAFATDGKENIIIALEDSTNLTIMDCRTGKVKAYRSVSSIEIQDMKYDRYGNVLILDYDDQIHFISKDGMFERIFPCCPNSDSCICNITSFCVNHDDNLLIFKPSEVLFAKYLQ